MTFILMLVLAMGGHTEMKTISLGLTLKECKSIAEATTVVAGNYEDDLKWSAICVAQNDPEQTISNRLKGKPNTSGATERKGMDRLLDSTKP